MSSESKVDRYREWLKNFPKRPPTQVALANAAIDAYERRRKRGQVAEHDLAHIVVAASAPQKLVFDIACKLLADLAEDFEEARDAFRRMSRDGKADARFHAVAYLDLRFPEPLRTEIIGRALEDRSAKVRKKGIERAEQFDLKQFLPQLEEMQERETNSGVLASLALHLPLLRDGYLLKSAADASGYHLTVRGPNTLGGPFIPKSEFSEAFLQQEIARLKSRRL